MGIIIISILMVFFITILIGRFTYAENEVKDKRIPPLKKCSFTDVDFCFKAGILSAIICILAFVVTFATSIVLTDEAIRKEKVEIDIVEISSHDIYALQDNYFISRRYYDNSTYYFTIEEFEGKGKTTQKYPSSNSYINYIPENEQPYVKTVERKIKNKSLYMIYFPLSKTEYYFYIPEGSIVEEYSIDLQ